MENLICLQNGAVLFDEETHTYTLKRSGKMLPSANGVLKAVYGNGLEGIPQETLDRVATLGKAKHKEIELVKRGLLKLEEAQYPETRAFYKWAEKNNIDIQGSSSELILAVDSPTWYFAGTADWIFGKIFDFKTSKTATEKQKSHWQKQLSFYYFAKKYSGSEPKGMSVLHLVGDKCEEIPLQYLGDEFVENTLRAYFSGQSLKDEKQEKETALQTIPQKELLVFADIVKKIKMLEKQVEATEEAIKAEMEKRNILSLDIGDVSISYIAPHKSKKFDSTKFKAEHENLYVKYQKETSVKGSIRIKVK